MTTVSTARRVLVVGGGAAGVITTAALLHELAGAGPASAPVQVTVVEPAAAVGPGLAYGTTDPHHLLNNYASRMSALEHDPAHLVAWCREQGMPVTGGSFVSRATYGRYLAALLEDLPVPHGSTVQVLRDRVVDLTDAGSAYLATTASGAVLTADLVVLALGNPPPRLPRGLDVPAGRVVLDPWAPGLVDRIGDRDRVLLVGTGLTTVDVAVTVGCARPGATITAVSRHGLLPLRHVPDAPGLAEGFDDDARTLPELLAAVRRSLAAGADWRSVVESVKAVANESWGSWSEQERERFTRHASRRWEIARHRMAPTMSAKADELVAAGRLTLAASRDVDPASYDLVVNCTGPAPVSSTGWNPLVDSLAVKGMLWPGPLGLGIDVDADGALLDADGLGARGIYAVGAARRGVDWEVAAVPDLRRQAVRLARHLTHHPTRHVTAHPTRHVTAHPTAPDLPAPV